MGNISNFILVGSCEEKYTPCHVAVYEWLLATQTEGITQEFYRTVPERFKVLVSYKRGILENLTASL